MHIVALRRDVYEKNPWIAQCLFKAFVAAQQVVYEDLHEMGALKLMLPWLGAHVRETEELMGRDFWPYGYQPNIHALTTFLRYHFEQGLSKRLLTPKELFAPESLESFKI
jgi:4,5-dihydroxyphthalate decarboxylase